MRLLSNITLAYKKLSYQSKLLLSYLIFILLPMAILCLYFYVQTNSIIRSQTAQLSQLRMTQSSEALSSRFSEMITLARTLSRQDTIRFALSKDTKSVTLVEEGEDLRDIQLAINRFYYDPSVFSVRLFINSDLSYANQNILTWPLSTIQDYFPGEETQIMDNIMLHGPTAYRRVLSEPETVFSVTTPILHVADYNNPVALVCVDSPQSSIAEILRSADFSEAGDIYLTDRNGVPIFGFSNATEQLIEENDYPDAFPPQEGQLLLNNNTWVTTSPLIWGTYHLVVLSPLKQLTNLNHLFPVRFTLFALMIGGIVYLIATAYARFSAGKIIQLSDFARQVQAGNLNVHCIVDSFDEIGELQISFNEMLRRINEMIEARYQLGQQIKDQELRLLQAQIDPHFLYNTLDMVIWTAQNDTKEAVCDIVRKLTRYYRISLSNGADVIPLQKELEHVTLYVALQNKRFQDKIHLHIDTAPGLENIDILKLLFQPLVENSIIHGFDGDTENISIRITESQGMLSIDISDDGLGIPPEKLAKLRLDQDLNLSCTVPDSYGLSNISARIKNYYGPQASMQYHSTPGGITSVRMLLPVARTHME